MKGNSNKSKKKVVFEFFPHDYSSLEKYLEAMAMEGWVLEEKDNLAWYFNRSEPKALKFRIVPFKKTKSETQEAFLNRSDLSLEEIAQAGWKLISSSSGIHIFYSETNIPLPGEDKKLTFKLMNKRSLKQILPPLIIFTIFLFLLLFIPLVNSNYIETLMNSQYILYLILFPIFIAFYMIEFIKYVIWYRKGNNSQIDRDPSRKDYLKAFNYKKFVRTTAYWIIPVGILLAFLLNSFNNEIKYPVTLPLTLDDMKAPVTAHHRKDAYKHGTFLLNNTVYYHQYEEFNELELESEPELIGSSLAYTVYKSKFPSLYDDIMKEFIFDMPYNKNPYTNIDPLPFGAETAYYNEISGFNNYILEYKDKVVDILVNFSMTEEQMKIVKEEFR